MTYLKRKLIRAKKQKDWEEEQERLRQEEIAERRKNPWKNEIATCNELLAYTRLLLPKNEESKQEVQQEETGGQGNNQN